MNIPKEALKTLLGVIMIKFTTGAITCWGSINLYILSHFHYQGIQITSHTNSIIILSVIIPISFLILFATKLSERFGYETVVRVSVIVFTLSSMVIYIKFTIMTMVIFSVFLPASAFAISSIPIINALWTQFPKNKNMVTALAAIFFGLGGVCWNFMFTLYVNPHNQPTQIIENDSNMSFFSRQVAQNVLPCMKIGVLLCGIIITIGGFLVKKNIEYEDSTISGEFELRDISLSNSFLPQIDQVQTKKKSKKNLKQALFDPRFISIFLISFITGVYQIFLNLNIKIIYMPILQDDRFLVYCVMFSTFSSILGAFFWGYIGDNKNFYSTLLIFSIFDLLVKIYGKFATNKLTIFLLFIFIGFIDKGMITIMGPGLVKIFGIQTATELLPFKGLSVFIGFLLAPLGYLILNSLMDPFQYLFLLSFYSLISVFLAYKLYKKHGQNKNS